MGLISLTGFLVQPSIRSDRLLSCVARTTTVELACEPDGAKVVNASNGIAEEIPPPEMTGSTVVSPSTTVVTVCKVGAAITMLELGEAATEAAVFEEMLTDPILALTELVDAVDLRTVEELSLPDTVMELEDLVVVVELLPACKLVPLSGTDAPDSADDDERGAGSTIVLELVAEFAGMLLAS